MLLAERLGCDISQLEEMLETRIGRYRAARLLEHRKFVLDGQLYDFVGFPPWKAMPTIPEERTVRHARLPDIIITRDAYTKLVPLMLAKCM